MARYQYFSIAILMFLAAASGLAQPSFAPCPSPQTADLCSTSTASVGIGANAADRLTVFGGTSNINIGGNYGSGYNGIWLSGGTASTNYNFLSSASDPTLYINSSVALQFRTLNNTRMYLDGNGNF